MFVNSTGQMQLNTSLPADPPEKIQSEAFPFRLGASWDQSACFPAVNGGASLTWRRTAIAPWQQFENDNEKRLIWKLLQIGMLTLFYCF